MVNNITKDYRFARPNREHYETTSLLSVPLLIGDTCIGVLNVNNKIWGDKFNKQDLDNALQLAQHLSHLIDQLLHYQSTRHKFWELMDNLRGLLQKQQKQDESNLTFSDKLFRELGSLIKDKE